MRGFRVLLASLWRKLLRAHYADLPRLAHTRAMAAFAPALTPMLATPPARVFAATNMLVWVTRSQRPQRGNHGPQ